MSPATVGDSTKPNIVGRSAGSPRSSAISGGGYAAIDTIYDGDGSVAPASRR